MSHAPPPPPLDELDEELEEPASGVPEDPEELLLDDDDDAPESFLGSPASVSPCEGGGSFTVSVGSVALWSAALSSMGSDGEVAHAAMRATSDRAETAMRLERSIGAHSTRRIASEPGQPFRETQW